MMKLTQSLSKSLKGFRFTFNWALFAIFVILFVTIASINSAFLYPDYIIGVMLRNIIEIGLMALPMTLIVITGGIDLSVGSIMVLSAIMGGIAAKYYGGIVGLIVTILIGTLCGLFNGLIIAKLKISPLVTTLATMFLFLGLARGISLGDSIYSYKVSEFFGTAVLFNIPIQIFLYIIFAFIFYLLLSKTTLGRSLYAIGLNENATKYSGINTNKVKIGIYTLSGFMCSIASLIWLGRFTSIKYDAGTSLNLIVVTVIVLGGTDIMGGYGDIKGIIIATLILAVLNSGLTVLNIPIATQIIANGIVLVISLITYAILNDKVKNSRIIKIDTAAIKAQNKQLT
jgi:ribose/xylose/arabinose/galactoside ABC-type transport system permease subunit